MTDETINEITEWIEMHYGEKCEEFNFNCPRCQLYMAVDILDNYLFLDEE